MGRPRSEARRGRVPQPHVQRARSEGRPDPADLQGGRRRARAGVEIMTVMPRLEDLEDKSFDPFLVEKLSTGDCPDPYPRIHELRAQGPVVDGSYRKQFTDVPDVQMGHLPPVMVLDRTSTRLKYTH